MRNVLVRPSKQAAGPTAFVLNVGLAGLGAIRSLGRAGVPVIGLDPDPSHAGFASRYCRAKRCPHPVHDAEHLVEFLLEEGRRLDQPGVLSPASDGFVLFLSRYRTDLQGHFRFNLPSPAVVEAAVSKRGLYELAGKCGLSHAATFYPESMADVARIQGQLDYPAYVKPYYSHLWQGAFPRQGKGIKVCSAAELAAAFGHVFANDVQAMVQSIIQGPATNVRTVYLYLTAAGDPLGVVTTRKIRQFPLEFGRGSLAESFHDADFAELGLRFFRDIGYRGFGTIEFKRDDRDGLLKATDLNPRWVKPINLPIASGVNFPLIHYRDLIGQPPSPQLAFQAGVRWLDTASDLAASWPAVRAGDVSPWAVGRSWLGARSFPAFAPDDWGPLLKELEYGRRIVRASLQRAWRR